MKLKFSIGNCPLEGKKAFKDAYAHAHNDTSDKNFGLICFQDLRSILHNGKLTSTLLHELAHLQTPNEFNHKDNWKERFQNLIGWRE
jgi:hypothetical protein